MTSPIVAIAAVAPVDPLLQALPKPAAAPGSEALVQKFDALMKSPAPEPAALAPAAEPNALSRVLNRQEDLLRQSHAEVDAFSARAGEMSMNEALAEGMRLSRDLALANLNLQTTTAVAQGSNKSLQTLLKNQ